MSKATFTKQELFTSIGHVEVVNGKKRFVLNSPDHYQMQLNKAPVGKPIAATFIENKASRSEQQLRYYFVLVGYIADHCGYNKEECHDALMRVKFGTRKIKIAGHVAEVRKSIANKARMPKYQCVELIDFALECCKELGIIVPTAKELGYISN